MPPAYRPAWRYRDARLTLFLFRSPMAAWLWGGLTIFHIPSSFGTTRIATSRSSSRSPVTTGWRGLLFEEAVKRRPGRIVTLRQKTRLLADSRRKN